MRPVSIEENSPTSIMNHHISCFTAGYWVPIMRFYCKLFVLLLDCTYHYGYRWYISCFITSIERTAYRIFQVQVKEFDNNALRCSTVLHTELHYSDVIISSQITGVSIGYWNRLFMWKSKKTSKLCVTGLCEGSIPLTGEFTAQRASHTENVSICHHGNLHRPPKVWHHFG